MENTKDNAEDLYVGKNVRLESFISMFIKYKNELDGNEKLSILEYPLDMLPDL